MIKFQNSILFVFLFISTINLNASEEIELNNEFKKYVPKESQYKCNGLNDLCKKFYIGYNLFSVQGRTKQSLEYLLEAYENNISSILKDDWDAKDNYLTDNISRLYGRLGDKKNQIKYLKLSIKAGEDQNICYLGREYDKLDMLKEAYELFKEGSSKNYTECFTDYGMYLFNGRYVKKDEELAGKYWEKAYWDDSYGDIANYNMAVYYGYKNNDRLYKYHMLKASLLGDEEAKSYLKSPYIKSISTTKLFLEEALGSKYKDISKVKNLEFSNSFDLYYRLKKMFNRKNKLYTKWEEDYEYQDKRWDEDKSNVVKFYRDQSSLIFEDKKLILETTLNNHFNQRKIIVDMKLLYKVLLVDLSEAKEFNKFYTVTVGLISKNESFEFKNKISQYNYKFYWYAKYDKGSGKLIVEIGIV
ncbi:SEL1-like repeat protein [Poseidonibacter lekithochrous]|uniref:sel1 repeat family protein n=1 Tax=Poseidonibacter lekithochrous TaxID=1904463 RepID=UPI000D3ACEAC|nr:sel1 repeat family protein [Poseidonibacter lekithochrous]